MTNTEEKGLSSSRVCGPPSANVDLLECSICQDVLWKPVACQSCETPFCSSCINQWLRNNPTKCPNRCEKYTERKCPPFIVKLLAQLQIRCSNQKGGCEEVISYEALDKHEIECGYQPQQCPGCRSEILKKYFGNHTENCTSIELICEDCNLVYKRGDATTKHTENICLRKQLRELRDESKKNKLEMQKLILQLNKMRTWKDRMDPEVTIKFNDLPMPDEKALSIPNMYRGLKWTEMAYADELYLKKEYPKSGYVTACTPEGSSHIAYFTKEASIELERPDETFTFVSLTACAAWNDDLQLTITGHRNSIQTNSQSTTLLFGIPQVILLHWKNINKVTFKPSDGTAHPGTGGSAGSHVVINQLTIVPVD